MCVQVVVYDVAGQEKLWSTQPGHTETIFDCCFAPGPSSDLLATCSFDGTVRVWDAATNTHLKTLDTKAPGREEVVVKGAVTALF
jgi:WD40 repeat protein